MKEQDFLNIIKNEIGTKYIGDDCAYLKDLDIVITQDSLVEDIHFKKEWYSPYQLGYKAVAVNISDILASGAIPAYLTISLSLPNNTTNDFIKDFYIGAKDCMKTVEIVGGDITGSDKIFISITAIGKTTGRKISSRKNAKPSYIIIVSKDSFKEFGLSSKGLKELLNKERNPKFSNYHIKPNLDIEFSNEIATKIKTDYAMMDCSDGLADALFKIAESSNVSINCQNIEGIFGSEDYKLVAAVPKDFLQEISNYEIIGEVIEKSDFIIKIEDKKFYQYDELKTYDHFGG